MQYFRYSFLQVMGPGVYQVRNNFLSKKLIINSKGNKLHKESVNWLKIFSNPIVFMNNSANLKKLDDDS